MSQITEEEAGYQFPCEFLIKAMGLAEHSLDEVVLEIVQKHCEQVDKEGVRLRPSRNGKYVSVNVRITAHSIDQLNAIYDELTAHEKILMRL